MLTTAQALDAVLALMAPLGTEEVPLAEAAGRVLARTVTARRTQPPFAASAMDGYAVRAAEAGAGMVLRVTGEAVAGRGFSGGVGPGEAVRIFTGAPVPLGADEVLIQEDAVRDGDRITVRAGRDAGPNIRPAGVDFVTGDPVPGGRRIGAGLLALLAAMNIDRVPVARRPVVALIPTGDELVWPGTVPGPDQIVSSNNFGLKALIEAQGGIARLLPIARDTPAALRAALALTAGADLVVTLGGASVGEHDLVAQVFGEDGLQLAFHRIAMRPGKPLMAGRIGGTAMLGLPGNPVSALVCGHLFLRPAIDAMLGLPAGPLPRETGVLGCDLGPNGPREHYMRATLDGRVVHPADNQDSSLLTRLAQADALLVRPPGQVAILLGTPVEFIKI